MPEGSMKSMNYGTSLEVPQMVLWCELNGKKAWISAPIYLKLVFLAILSSQLPMQSNAC